MLFQDLIGPNVLERINPLLIFSCISLVHLIPLCGCLDRVSFLLLYGAHLALFRGPAFEVFIVPLSEFEL